MKAILVAIDTVFLGGFALSSEVLADRLMKYGLQDNDPHCFVRSFYGKNVTTGLKQLLPEQVDVAHVERRLATTYSALLQQNALAAQPLIRQVLRPLAKMGVKIGVVSHLRPETITELFDGIAEDVFAVFDALPISVGIPPSVWQQLIVRSGYPVRQCMALVSCGVSVRTALQVGLQSVLVPDPMTAFDSSTGASLVAETMNKTFITKLKARFSA